MIADGEHRGWYQLARTPDELSWRHTSKARIDLQPDLISISSDSTSLPALQVPRGTLSGLQVRPLGKSLLAPFLATIGGFVVIVLLVTGRATQRTGSGIESLTSGQAWFLALFFGAVLVLVMTSIALEVRRRWVVMQVGDASERLAVAIRIKRQKPEVVADAISTRLGTPVQPT